jgi:hypothetical protein
MENKIYKIYHIPTFIHKDGRIGKIGCTELEAKERVADQGYIDFEILEEHTDIMIASDREIELQKQYGYPVDRKPYWKVIMMATKEDCSKGGIAAKLVNAQSKAGKVGGKLNKDKGKPVLMIDKITNEIIQEFPAVVTAARFLQKRDNKILAVLHGEKHRYTAYGYKWKWKPTTST